jgi:hypothetical protein
MENSFWFVCVGLAIFGLHCLRHKFPFRLSWLAYAATGAGIGVLIGRVRPVEIDGFMIPLWYAAYMGGLAALLLWGADQLNLLSRDIFKYTIVIVLSLIHAFVSYTLLKIVIPVHEPELIFPRFHLNLFFQILLISTVSIVGFSFPARLMKQPSQEDSE